MLHPTDTHYALHPMADTYDAICQGETPWVALGNFMNDFFGYAPEQRHILVQDAPRLPAAPSQEQRQWAVFCAATVDYLCQHYHIQVPNWVQGVEYTPLSEPWYHGPGAKKPPIQELLRQETPPEFAVRNIFCGSADRLFPDKYEKVAQRWYEQRQSA